MQMCLCHWLRVLPAENRVGNGDLEPPSSRTPPVRRLGGSRLPEKSGSPARPRSQHTAAPLAG